MSKQIRKNRKPSNTRNKKDIPSEGVKNGKCQTSEMRPNVITEGENNDSSWYTHIYTSADKIASIPFSYPSGVDFDPLTHQDNGVGETCQSVPSANSFPGICTFRLMPTIGKCNDYTDGANEAMQQLFTIVRSATTGSMKYDGADLMMAVLAMDSAYMLYNELCRAYRVYSVYDPMNRYQPNGILTALGYAPSLEKDRGNMAAILDLFAYRIASIPIPDQFDYIKRHAWLYANVYTDAPNSKAQFYAYVPDGYYVWTEGQGDTPTHLKYVSREELFGIAYGQTVSTIDQIQHAMDTLMNPIIGSTDIGLMSGDLKRAFGDSNLIKIAPVSTLDAWTPAYSEEVLLQMMNSTICSARPISFKTSSGTLNCDITVDYSDLVKGPVLQQNVILALTTQTTLIPFTQRLLNVINSEPTPENVLVMSRLITYGTNVQTSAGSYFQVETSGTEIVTEAHVWYNEPSTDNSGAFMLEKIKLTQYSKFDVQNPGDGNEALGRFYDTIIQLSKFDYAPALYLFTPGSPGSPAIKFNGVVQDVCNYTWLSKDIAKTLNDVCIMSEFYVRDYETSLTK